MIRRSLFIPSYTTLPKILSIETIVAIPLPAPVHSIASTLCSSYLLTGSQEGYIRVYDFWASVNGRQLMTAQQRTIVGLGDGVSKAGVGRGWWTNEVEGLKEGGVSKRLEPVYSLACEGDGLWALAGTRVSPCEGACEGVDGRKVGTYQLVLSSTFTWTSRIFTQGSQ